MSKLHLLSPAGFRAAGVYAGIKSRKTPDVGLLICDGVATAAAAFTTNQVVSPAVTVGKRHVASGRLRGIVVNAGNANACTGKRGEKDALTMCQIAAKAIGAKPGDFLPSSTGIIGHFLPMDKLQPGIIEASKSLGDDEIHALEFADAILTTDLKRKAAAVEFKVGRETIRIAGVTKGSGMIGPRIGVPQATMLAYLTTDAAIPAPLLKKTLQQSVDVSFNCVTVDDHASTNDTAAILASGASGVKIDSPKTLKLFAAALTEVSQSLAYQIAADGEGATKVVIIEVVGATSESDAKLMARAIANSPLVKCAMNGNDPNWGRIVSAAGMTAASFDPDQAELTLQNTVVFRGGQPVKFDAAKVSKSLKAPEVRATLNCGRGKGSATIWTCDLSKQYVTINADYHT